MNGLARPAGVHKFIIWCVVLRVRYAFSKNFVTMNFPAQGVRRSSLHWTSPRGHGTVSRTARTKVLAANEAMGGVYPG